MKIRFSFAFISIALFGVSCSPQKEVPQDSAPASFSGIYPHLAYYNNEAECGTGAVVPWADKLWVITYGPHLPFGSSDKLYEISTDLQMEVRPESIGGTPANRMIHQESNQLFIGPYAIDREGNVRAISYEQMPGRHTGNARHLTDPAGKIYYGTMEEGFYEVDVATLTPTTLYRDGNVKTTPGEVTQANKPNDLLVGAHGKGLYSGQGVMVYSNNGEASKEALQQFDIESGVLAEWDTKAWQVIRRNQFVEVTGPGGIYGNANPDTDPVWATGWDHKSVLVGVLDKGKWNFFRLPKASHSYDGAHGWNTEWPRIRNVGTEGKADYLMTMHGMFWKFPETFSSGNSAGIRPRSAYLKVIGDFTRWQDQLVFGCDDSAQREFLNKRKAKGGIEGPGQSNSNLWFTSFDLPDQLGPNTASGAVWLSETVEADKPSEPFLFAGWTKRVAWIHNEGNGPVNFTFEADENGKGDWNTFQSKTLNGGSSDVLTFPSNVKGEWVRVKTNAPARVTVHFSYSNDDKRSGGPDDIFRGLAQVTQQNAVGGLLYGLGNDRRALGIAAKNYEGANATDIGYYELDGNMRLNKKEDAETHNFILEKFAIPTQTGITVEESSVLVVDDQGRRWRLPLGHDGFTSLTSAASLRVCREVATERDLLNFHGTFYELPAENADGFAKIRPVSSHSLRINDYASYRGLLVMSGIDPQAAKTNKNIVVSDDGKLAVWAGTIDDLWKLGKPVGKGGPWINTSVKPSIPSDPYLIGFYDKKTLTLSHDHPEEVTFTIEVEPIGHGPWMKYKEIKVASGEKSAFTFPDSFQARWIRFKTDKPAKATAFLMYE